MREHCCDLMRRHVQAISEPAALVASDRAVLYDLVFDEYCLAAQGTALAAEVLLYCPWCGVGLPASKRERWFSELDRLGIGPDDPRLDDRYRSDAWWRAEPPTEANGAEPNGRSARRDAVEANGAAHARRVEAGSAADAGGVEAEAG
jgi:uncharacterized protein DUF6980